jgi:membrane carboxypeptidase/penicillin-binding protein
VALPIWLGYMEQVLKELPEQSRSVPPGVVALPTVSYPNAAGEAKVSPEFFYQEAVPPPEVLQPPPPPPVQPPAPLPEQTNPPA